MLAAACIPQLRKSFAGTCKLWGRDTPLSDLQMRFDCYLLAVCRMARTAGRRPPTQLPVVQTNSQFGRLGLDTMCRNGDAQYALIATFCVPCDVFPLARSSRQHAIGSSCATCKTTTARDDGASARRISMA